MMLLVATFLLQEQSALYLQVGTPVQGEIRDLDEVLHTPILDSNAYQLETRGKQYRIEIIERGLYCIELHSDFIDTYLVLRDGEGRVLTEDDDGMLAYNSRILAELEPGSYLADAGALHELHGPFELTLEKGWPRELYGEELRRADLEDLERSLAIVQAAHGLEHPATAARLADLATLVADQGDYPRARALREQALAIREKVLGPEHLNTAWSQFELGRSLRMLGEHARARPLLESALATREKKLGPGHDWTAQALDELGILCFDEGDYPAARLFYERALAIKEQVWGPDDGRTAIVLNNLAVLLWSQGDNAAARPLYERALAIRRRVLGTRNMSTALSMRHLGVLLWSEGDYSGAQELYEGALATQEALLGRDHPTTTRTLYNLAILLCSKGEPAAAIPLFERALVVLESTMGSSNVTTTEVLNGMARARHDLGEHAAALALYQRALAGRMESLGPEHRRTIEVLNDLALLLAESGDAREAWAVLRRDHDRRSQGRMKQLVALSEAERYRYLAWTGQELEIELSLAAHLGDGLARRQAYEDVLAWKGQVARLLSAGRKQLAEQMSSGQLQLRDELWAVQAELSGHVLRGGEMDEALGERIDALREKRNRLELELERSLAASVPRASGPSFAELSAALPAGSAALDFYVHRRFEPAAEGGGQRWSWSEPRISAWITRPGSQEPLHLDLGPAARLQTIVHDFLEELVVRRGVAVQAEAAGKPAIGEHLWQPLAAHLDGVEMVFVSPDGFLAGLPFEVLPIGDERFAIERLTFAYAQDLTSLIQKASTAPGELSSLLAMGGVDFRARAAVGSKEPALIAQATLDTEFLRGGFTDYWPSLPATRDESQVVLELHEDAFGAPGKRLLLQDEDPTEERLKRELPRHAILHLATHGFFQPEGLVSLADVARAEVEQERPQLAEVAQHLLGKHPGLLSGLVCAGANRPAEGREDGFLTAEEVAWLDLSRTELVVLSACETGLGRAQSGEGMLGLRHAFHLAGARTVISSLWSVRDESTAALMQDFYQNLLQRRLGRVAALRAAQLELLRRSRAEGHPRPSAWGAFVLSGEWR